MPEMKIVRRRVLLLSAGGATVLVISSSVLAQAGPGSARSSADQTSHKLTATIQEVDIRMGPVPSAGSTATAAATIESTPGGSGAQVTHLKFTGPTGAPATFGFHAKATDFFASGSFTLSVSGTLTIQSNGQLAFAGRGKITGGTNRYKHARGSVKFTGTAPSPAPGHVDTFRQTGTIIY